MDTNAALGLASSGLVVGVVVAIGLYEVITARPNPLSLNHWLYKRDPATPADCTLQGASALLFGGWSSVWIVQTFTSVFGSASSVAAQSYPWAATALTWLPWLVGLSLFVGWWAVGSRVRYVSLRGTKPAT